MAEVCGNCGGLLGTYNRPPLSNERFCLCRQVYLGRIDPKDNRYEITVKVEIEVHKEGLK